MIAALQARPPGDAIAALDLRGKKLNDILSWQEAYREDHAVAQSIAQTLGFDVSNDIQTALETALKAGQSPRQFAKDLTPLLKAKGWWGKKLITDPRTGEKVAAQLGSAKRLDLIFGVNMRVSYASAHWKAFEQSKADRPFLRYVAILDDATRPAHRARHNLVLPVDHPYWNKWAPPCGWNCRCTLQSLSQRDINRLVREGEELFYEPPQDSYRSFTNKVTGEVTKVPDGIDPGWDYNPGKASHLAVVRNDFAVKVASGSYELSKAAIETVMTSKEFINFLQKPDGAMAVMSLNPMLSKALNTSAAGVILSDTTMLKQISHHSEMTIDDYRLLPLIGDQPLVAVQDGDQTIVLARLDDNKWRRASIKTTLTRRAAFLLSYRFASDDEIDKLINRKRVTLIFDRR